MSIKVTPHLNLRGNARGGAAAVPDGWSPRAGYQR